MIPARIKRIHMLAIALGALLLVMGCSIVNQFELPLVPTPALGPTLTPEPTTAPKPGSEEPTPGDDLPDEIYTDMLAQVKRSDPDLDFTAFRMAYAESSGYDPYFFGLLDQLDQMLAAYDNGDYQRAAELAEGILAQNYHIPDAHMVAYISYDELGQDDKASHHDYFLDGTINSIFDSGDGKSPETAYVVVLIQEEYLLLGVLDVIDAGQSLVEENGHMYDVFEGRDKITNEPVTIYFNVDSPYHSLGEGLNLPSAP